MILRCLLRSPFRLYDFWHCSHLNVEKKVEWIFSMWLFKFLSRVNFFPHFLQMFSTSLFWAPWLSSLWRLSPSFLLKGPFSHWVQERSFDVALSWASLRCLLKLSSLENDLPHLSQSNCLGGSGLFSSCLLCFVYSLKSVNSREHFLHWMGSLWAFSLWYFS